MSTEVEALLTKARRWRAAGWFTDSEWGAIMAVFHIEVLDDLSREERERWQIAGQWAAARLVEWSGKEAI